MPDIGKTIMFQPRPRGRWRKGTLKRIDGGMVLVMCAGKNYTLPVSGIREVQRHD